MSARHAGGQVLLRLEDLDRGRSRNEYVDACIEDVSWLGLDWDGEPYLQSSRADDLMATAETLVAEGQAYPCTCTRREVREALSAPHLRDRPARYPGTCRGRFDSVQEAQAESGRRPTLRFLCPSGDIEVEDKFLKSLSFNPSKEFGDFPIASPDGQVSYHLAVVIDDDHQGVTEVLRGDDLASSCGPQAALQAALGIHRPSWVHVPLVLDEDGERLAKRSDSLSIRAVRDAGVAPESLVAWLLTQSGLPCGRSTSAGDALSSFSLDRLNPEPVRIPPGFAGIFR